MKIRFVSSLVKLTLLMLMIGVVMVSCKDDDDDDTPPVVVLDGYYVTGAGTAVTDIGENGLMTVARNEVVQEDREELMELYMAVQGEFKSGDGFNITAVSGSTTKVYGPGPDFEMVPNGDLDTDEPKNGLWRGSLVETTDQFTVPNDGLYHIVFDSELMVAAIAKVDWTAIGGATPGGWSEGTSLTSSAFDLNTISFEIDEIVMLENEWKFRYSNGWKIILDADYDLGGADKGIKVNTNFGGAVDALLAGGDNMVNDAYAVYKIGMTWELGKGHTASFEYVKDGEPLANYPDSVYMIGASVGGWDWALVDLPMNATHSHPELFWKILWIEAGVDDAGFKFAPQRDWIGDFGVAGDPTDGVWEIGTDNVPEPAVSGHYMVVVNLETETIEVNAPTVYLIGDAAGTWDAGVAENLFTVDNANEVVTITKDMVAGNLRMYAAASTLTADWWQAEFMVFDGAIEYRSTGDDQEAVPLTEGSWTINLKFTDEIGEIIAN